MLAIATLWDIIAPGDECWTFLCRNLLQPCIRNTGIWEGATQRQQCQDKGQSVMLPQVCIDLSIVDKSFLFKLTKREFIHFFNHTEFFILHHIFSHRRSQIFTLYLLTLYNFQYQHPTPKSQTQFRQVYFLPKLQEHP